ncbi:hypothetical protein VaNZ11_006064 [Volvox africanus]|uniref:DNA 3'-5' helicase n=1 Tax=Volvox africanus TaxID=51714 RepID=A0ABQ5S033_9CHLO|nr:hypothetical protein VaNZ11_006064 [Volvox africanus]
MSKEPSRKRGMLSLEPTDHQGTAKRPAVTEAARNRALAMLKSTYGFETFRGKQEEAVLAALAGRDTLVIMPTGGGKTICYVIPALMQPGVCIVVSPLLALMQDQVANLTKVGVRAAQLSSALPVAQRAAVLADLTGTDGGDQPTIRLLLVTPELLAASGRFRSVLRQLHTRRNLSLFAIDESHCISSWGHDFRPTYRQLQVLRRDFPGVPIMALTATATSQVQDDICEQLRLHNPLRLLTSFNRPNISYAVRYLDVEELSEVEALVKLLRERLTSGGTVPCSIVYCQKRETCEEVAEKLSREGLPAKAYHGQMNTHVKKEVLRQWQADEVPVVVATIAFGMGIDKAGVRLVVHFNLPRSLEGYYQEAGRGGRDGLPAESVLFYSRQARKRMDYVLEQDARKKAATKGRRKGSAAAARTGMGGDEEDEGEEGEEGGKGGAGGGGGSDEPDVKDAVVTAVSDKEVPADNLAWKAFGQVVDWVLTADCRRNALLAHFGERSPGYGPCGPTGAGHAAGCDYCRDPQHVREQLAAQKQKDLEITVRSQGSGKGDDEETNMFAVRGGCGGGDYAVRGSGGGGDGNDDEEGPGIYHPPLVPLQAVRSIKNTFLSLPPVRGSMSDECGGLEATSWIGCLRWHQGALLEAAAAAAPLRRRHRRTCPFVRQPSASWRRRWRRDRRGAGWRPPCCNSWRRPSRLECMATVCHASSTLAAWRD